MDHDLLYPEKFISFKIKDFIPETCHENKMIMSTVVYRCPKMYGNAKKFGEFCFKIFVKKSF